LTWLILLLLDEKEAAAEALKQYESIDTPQTIASWLVYHKFEPSPAILLLGHLLPRLICRRTVFQ
jgi:hypothetical protein